MSPDAPTSPAGTHYVELNNLRAVGLRNEPPNPYRIQDAMPIRWSGRSRWEATPQVGIEGAASPVIGRHHVYPLLRSRGQTKRGGP